MVSHSLNSLKEFCDVAIVFKDDNAVGFFMRMFRRGLQSI